MCILYMHIYLLFKSMCLFVYLFIKMGFQPQLPITYWTALTRSASPLPASDSHSTAQPWCRKHEHRHEPLDFISALYFQTSAQSSLILSYQCVFPDVHDQPSAIFSEVHRFHIHHNGLNSRLILWEEKNSLWMKAGPWHGAVVTTLFASVASMIPARENTNTCWIQSSVTPIKKKLWARAKSRI